MKNDSSKHFVFHSQPLFHPPLFVFHLPLFVFHPQLSIAREGMEIINKEDSTLLQMDDHNSSQKATRGSTKIHALFDVETCNNSNKKC
jgi:hypothetical protein